MQMAQKPQQQPETKTIIKKPKKSILGFKTLAIGGLGLLSVIALKSKKKDSKNTLEVQKESTENGESKAIELPKFPKRGDEFTDSDGTILKLMPKPKGRKKKVVSASPKKLKLTTSTQSEKQEAEKAHT